jgi:hypothetical protein
MRAHRVLTAVLLLGLPALLVVPMTRLHTSSPLDRADIEIVEDALPRLAFLRRALDGGAAEQMQRLFPEGYFFSYALYGLTWVDVGARSAQQRDRALSEARWALEHVDSPAGRAVFDESLDPPYGVFYQGWTTWLRGGVARLAGPGSPESARFATDARQLADAFSRTLAESGSPFLPAYPGQAWPCDSTVGIAAVRLAGDQHAGVVERWLSAAAQRRDPATGLLPHTADPVTGQPTSGARATSQTIILRFLPEVDPAAARRDWATFRELFASQALGIPGVREHPQGTDLPGDVDSGPLIHGLSASASAVALGDAVLYRDRSAAAALTGLAEATGLPIEWNGARRYLGGQLPIGDAFLAWSLTARPWITQPNPVDTGPTWTWRIPWHLTAWALTAPFLALATWLLLTAQRRNAVGDDPVRAPVGSRSVARRLD